MTTNNETVLTPEAIQRTPAVFNALLAYYVRPCDKEGADVVRAILDCIHPAASEAKPPRLPTREMLNAAVPAWHTWKSCDNGGSIQALGKLMWEHMLEAAPTIRNPLMVASEAGAVPNTRPAWYDEFAWKEFLKSHGLPDDSTPPAPVEAGAVPMYVEARECSECCHVGINDSHGDDAACNACGWSGPSPKEDICPGCAEHGTMTAACPKCSGRYSLLADASVGAPPSAPAAEPVPDVTAIYEFIEPRIGRMPTSQIVREALSHFAAPPAESAQSADACTDPDNCRRCQTQIGCRGNLHHAGIPLGQPTAATADAQVPLFKSDAMMKAVDTLVGLQWTYQDDGQWHAPDAQGDERAADIEEMRAAFELAKPAVKKFHYQWDADAQRYLLDGDADRGQGMQNEFADWCEAWCAALSRQPSAPASAGDERLPAGYIIVPAKPTIAACITGAAAVDNEINGHAAAQVYAAMTHAMLHNCAALAAAKPGDTK